MSQPRDDRQDDLFRPLLEEIINLRHPLVRHGGPGRRLRGGGASHLANKNRCAAVSEQAAEERWGWSFDIVRVVLYSMRFCNQYISDGLAVRVSTSTSRTSRALQDRVKDRGWIARVSWSQRRVAGRSRL
jgi:hypothetical protein